MSLSFPAKSNDDMDLILFRHRFLQINADWKRGLGFGLGDLVTETFFESRLYTDVCRWKAEDRL